MATRLVLLIAFLAVSSATYPAAKPQHYGKKKKNEFMPADSGERPTCSMYSRRTYCIDPEDYPKDRILYLLQNKMFNPDKMLMDETTASLQVPIEEPSYGAPKPSYLPPQPPSMYGRPNHYHRQSGYTPAMNQSSSSYSSYGEPHQLSMNGGRYKRQILDDEGPGDLDLCPSRTTYINPRAAQSVQGDWMFLVNLDEDSRYTQLVKSETCLRSRCSGACQAPPGSVAVCQQQFVQKRLVALESSGRSLSQEVFWFPSCCICKIMRQNN